MPHPENLHPAGMFANITSRAATDQAADIHLRTGFGKRKIGRTKTDLHLSTEHFLHEKIQGLFEIGKGNIFIYI